MWAFIFIHLINWGNAGAFTTEKSCTFIPEFQGAELLLDSTAYVHQNESLKISRFKCYLSDFKLLLDSQVVWKEEESHHLLDAEQLESLKVNWTIPAGLNYTSIEFNIGIDSLTNTSGAMRGDLDPTKGMFWTWQSGYINFKLEGVSRLCPERKNKFQFHLGGYLPPNETLQTVCIPVAQHEHLRIGIELDKFFSELDLKETYKIMSPGQRAVELSEMLPHLFYAKP